MHPSRAVLVLWSRSRRGAEMMPEMRDRCGAGEESVDGDALVRRMPSEQLQLDDSDDASVDAGIAAVLRDHGRIDGVVIAAAPSARTLDPSRNSEPQQVLEAVNGKTLTFLRVANAALQPMRERGYGRIVGISGQGAFVTGNVKKTGRIPDGGGWRAHGKDSPEARAVAQAKKRGARAGYVYLHSAIDGHTRLAYTEALENEQASTAVAFLDRARNGSRSTAS